MILTGPFEVSFGCVQAHPKTEIEDRQGGAGTMYALSSEGEEQHRLLWRDQMIGFSFFGFRRGFLLLVHGKPCERAQHRLCLTIRPIAIS
jgi:hypothetical protein